jgi:Rrf2 family transcriptional regulator, iron-sulfur cluster assembly transcription factor
MLSSLMEYGLRCLLQLAREREGPLTAREIAGAEGLSTPYVEKILAQLREGGLVKSVRGVRGGFLLTLPPEQTSLKDVFMALGSPLFTKEACERFTGLRETCVHTDDCGIRSLWFFLTREIDRVLERTVLSDLLQQERKVTTEMARCCIHE